MDHHDAITLFGETNRRPPHRLFGVKHADRFLHLYAIGRTGTGKSTLLQTLALQDIHSGRGLAVIDPHGDLVEALAANVPSDRAGDVVYVNPASGQIPLRYNPLRKVRADKVALAASGVLEAFKKIWGKAWGVRMEHILRNALFALIEYPDTIGIILSGYTDLAPTTGVVGDGAIYRFLTKPWNNDALRRDVRQAFRLYSEFPGAVDLTRTQP